VRSFRYSAKQDQPADTLDFVDLANLLKVNQKQLAHLIGQPHFPQPISQARRGVWSREAINAWIERARKAQQQQRGGHSAA
jgi:predicted DNA-binding transcriptional regulator AlpA